MDVVAERFGGRGGDSPEEKRVPWWVAAFHLTPHEFKRLFLEMQVRPRTRGARTGTGGAGVQSRDVVVTAHREAPYQSGPLCRRPFCRWDVGRSIRHRKGGEYGNKKEYQALRSGIGGLPDGRYGVR